MSTEKDRKRPSGTTRKSIPSGAGKQQGEIRLDSVVLDLLEGEDMSTINNLLLRIKKQGTPGSTPESKK